MNKYYGLTEKQNQNYKDESPEWMNDFFVKFSNEKPKKENPFKDCDNFLLNNNTNRVMKCKTCGQVLCEDEIDYCINCI